MRKEAMDRKRLVLLFVAAIFLAVLLLSFCGNAYGDPAKPNSITPGEGGGGHYNPRPHTVEGWISPYSGLQHATGLKVFLFVTYGWSYSATADEEGHFEITAYDIYPNGDYLLCINGGGDDCYLGHTCIDPHWGQWSAVIYTDSIGYYCSDIFLEPATTVNVTAAALFSNTEYATCSYGIESNKIISHSLSFSSTTAGISIGFDTTKEISISYGVSFSTAPGTSQVICRPFYAPVYKDEYLGTLTAGIGEHVEHTQWGSATTHEYLDKQNPPTADYVDFPVAPGALEYTYKETGSWTWSASAHVPFEIICSAFGQVISVDTTVSVTSEYITWLSYTIDNTSGHDLMFRVYTGGARPDLDTETCGLELHVWLKDW
jgi:hypothetical protein